MRDVQDTENTRRVVQNRRYHCGRHVTDRAHSSGHREQGEKQGTGSMPAQAPGYPQRRSRAGSGWQE